MPSSTPSHPERAAAWMRYGAGAMPAVGAKLALHRDGRWEPVTVVEHEGPGRVTVVFDGYMGSDLNFYRSHHDTVAVSVLRPREGVTLYWHYRRVLAWTAVIVVISATVFGVLFTYFKRENDARQAAEAEAVSPLFGEGDRVSISWKGDWYPGVILEVRGDDYLVSYDGYDESWNEVVDASRLRPPERR